MCFPHNVQFQKISIPTPWKVNANSEGVGVSKAKILKGKYGAGGNSRGVGGGGGVKPKNLPFEWYGYFLEQHNQHFFPHNIPENVCIIFFFPALYQHHALI